MRYIWKGNISFGLINIPVGLFTAARDHEIKFTLLHKKDLSEIRYARICKAEEKEIPYDEIVKGFAEDGRYAVMTPEDFKRAEGEKTKAIEIVTFCDESEVDSVYYEKPYFMKAEKGGEKAYFLLQQGLLESGKVAIARYVFKNHYHIAAIKPYQHALVLNQMRFHSQIVDLEELAINEKVKVAPAEVEMAKKLINQLGGHFKPETFHDRYVEDLQKAIGKKSLKGAKAKGTMKKPKTAQVYDLMTLLKASLEEAPKTSRKKAKTK